MNSTKIRTRKSVVSIALTLCLIMQAIPCTVFAGESEYNYDLYVATGDSVTEGYGLNGFVEGQSVYNAPADSYTQLVKKAESAEMVNLARSGWTPGQYYNLLNTASETSTDIQKLRDADLITIEFGLVNVYDTVLIDYLLAGLEDIMRIPTSQRSRFKQNLADMLANGCGKNYIKDRLVGNITFSSSADKEYCEKLINAAINTADYYTEDIKSNTLSYVKYLIRGGAYDVVAEKMVEYGVAEGIDKTTMEKAVNDLEYLFNETDIKAAFEKAYAEYTDQIDKVIEKIRSINTNNARILLIGYYDPSAKMQLIEYEGITITLTYVLENILGDPFDNLSDYCETYINKMNTYLKSKTNNTHMTYVDISGMPNMSYTYALHPSEEDNVYIANKVIAAAETAITHSWKLKEVTKAATETETGLATYYCTICNEEKEEVIPVKSSGGGSGGSGGGGAGGGTSTEEEAKEDADKTDETDEAAADDSDATSDEDAEAAIKESAESTTMGALSLKAYSNGKIKLTWKNGKGNTDSIVKYQIYRAKDKKFKKNLKKYTSTGKSYTLTKSLKKGTRYYVKVRAQIKINGKTYYSKWSAVKSVKCRKTR